MNEAARPTYDGLSEARRLLRSIRSATLATLQAGSGFPLATLTTLATDYAGSPILLLSQLSSHTRNLDADGRCSLLLAERGKGDPLTHPRLSLVGTAAKVAAPHVRASLRSRFLRRNPKASLYVDFGDFSFWRLNVKTAHMNGGFAKAADFEGDGVMIPVPEGLPAAEEAWLAQLNKTAQAKLRATVIGAGGPDYPWQVTGLDGGGLDLAAGEHIWRLPFPMNCASIHEIAGEIGLLSSATLLPG